MHRERCSYRCQAAFSSGLAPEQLWGPHRNPAGVGTSSARAAHPTAPPARMPSVHRSTVYESMATGSVPSFKVRPPGDQRRCPRLRRSQRRSTQAVPGHGRLELAARPVLRMGL